MMILAETPFWRAMPVRKSRYLSESRESNLFLPDLTLGTRIKRLLSAGGFPEAYLNPKEAARLRNDRMELVTARICAICRG